MSTEPPIAKAVCEVATKSDYPYCVQSYQFKALEDARRFSKELTVIPRSNHWHSAYRHLDVTTTEPGQAEKEYAK